jgi:hypothetical protein
MAKSVFKSTIFILSAFFGASSVGLATDMTAGADGLAGAKSQALHHQADPRTWDQIRYLHPQGEKAAVYKGTWYEARHLHGEASADGQILARK